MVRSSCSRAAALAGAALCAVPLAARAQAVSLQFTPAVGQVTRYKTTSQAWTTGDTTAAPMVTTAYTTRTVVSMDGPNYVVRTTFDSTVSSAAQGRDPMRGMAITQHMDPRGRILATEMTPPPGLPPFVASMMQRNSSSNSNRGVVVPDHPLNPGDTWTDTMATSGDGGRGRPAPVTFIVTYKLERVEGRTAVLSMNGAEQGGMNGTVTGEMTIDLGAGRLARMTSSSVFQAQQGGGPMRVKTTVEALP